MTLNMIRLEPDMRRAARWGAERRLAPPGADTGYLWHALLSAAFGDLAPKPWRLIEPDRGPAYLLGYAKAGMDALLDHARAFADPAVCAAVGLDTFSAKAMPERFALGRRLGFEVRLRPVTRSSFLHGGAGRGGRDHRIEIDVALHATLATREANPEAPLPDADETYKSWLAQHLARGGARALPESMTLVWRRRAAIVRKDANRQTGTHGRKGGGPDIGVAGVLEVIDADAFATLLEHGVGRHKAFGFGMLLLRPA